MLYEAEDHGTMHFQYWVGMDLQCFLLLLELYLDSVVFIGSSLASGLSKVYLSHQDVWVLDRPPKNVKIFQFVDDYLVLSQEGNIADSVVDTLKSAPFHFSFTYKPSSPSGEIHFLGMRLLGAGVSPCCMYFPQSGKALLPHDNAHSWLMKFGIVTPVLVSAPTRSCCHQIAKAFSTQVWRLTNVDFPSEVLRLAAKKLLRGPRSRERSAPSGKNIVVILYIRDVSPKLRVAAAGAAISVVFPALN